MWLFTPGQGRYDRNARCVVLTTVSCRAVNNTTNIRSWKENLINEDGVDENRAYFKVLGLKILLMSQKLTQTN